MKTRLIIALALVSFVGCTPKAEAPPEEPPKKEEAVEEEKPPTKEVEIEVVRQEQPDDAMGPGSEEQQTLLIKAKTAFLNEQWETAEVHFLKLTQTGDISGPQVTAYIALGDIYNDSDRAEEAQALYTQLAEKAPEVPEVHFVLARTLADQGETTKAMKAYEKTITMQPDYLQAMVELGSLYAKSGRKEEAEQLLYKYEQKVYKLSVELEQKDTDPARKLELLEIFSFIDDDRANQAITKNVLDPDPLVRERAIWLAVDLKLGAVTPNLEVLAQSDPSRRVKLAAKEALRTLADAPTTGASPTVVEPDTKKEKKPVEAKPKGD